MSIKKLANQFKKEQKAASKPFAEVFTDAIDDYLVREKEERPNRIAIKPSSFYKCQRAVWYGLNDIKGEKKKYPRSERILQVGTALHEWIQTEVLMPMGKSDSPVQLIPAHELPVGGREGIEFIKEHKAPEMEIKFLDHRYTKEIPISAMIDGAIFFNNKDFLFEFKTINPDDFKLLYEPLKEHVMQGAIYSLCLELPVMFLYLCKGTQHFKAYLIEYTEEQITWVKDRVSRIEGFYLDKELPPKEGNVAECKWCTHKKLCEAENDF